MILLLFLLTPLHIISRNAQIGLGFMNQSLFVICVTIVLYSSRAAASDDTIIMTSSVIYKMLLMLLTPLYLHCLIWKPPVTSGYLNLN